MICGQAGVRGLPRIGAGGMLPKSPLRSPERRNRAAFAGRSSRERGIERGRSAKTVASRRRIAYPVRAMKAKMVILVWCLSAHSGPPLAASQGNSRARTLRSLSASVTRVVLSGPCPLPRARSSLLLWFVVSPLPLVKGKHNKPSKETP